MKSYNTLTAGQFVIAKFIWFIVAIVYFDLCYFHIKINEISNENGDGLILFICWIIDMLYLLTIIAADYIIWKRRVKDTDLDYDKWMKLYWVPFLYIYLFFVDSKTKNNLKQIKDTKSKDSSNNYKNNLDDEESKFVSKQLKKLNKKDKIKETDHSSYTTKSKDIKQDKNKSISKEEALNKLKEKKKLLDLEIITQEEYDKVKDELKSIIVS